MWHLLSNEIVLSIPINNIKYRVIEKEGQNLQGYFTTWKCFLGAVFALILVTFESTSTFSKIALKNSLRHNFIHLYENMTDLDLVKPTFVDWLHPNAFFGHIICSIAPYQMYLTCDHYKLRNSPVVFDPPFLWPCNIK